MELIINPESCIRDLKKQFNAQFPHLKLEIIKREEDPDVHGRHVIVLDPDLKLADVAGRVIDTVINYSEDQTVADFEHLFLKTHGLSVQVFRSSGRVYLETSATDDWTLKQQNAEAEASLMDNRAVSDTDLNDRDQAE